MGDEGREREGHDGEATRGDARSGLGPVAAALLAVTLAAAMIVLVVTLTRGHGQGRDAIDAYLAARARGATASSARQIDEEAAMAEAARALEGLSITNFQSQAHTSCFWATLRLRDGRDVDARFVVTERDGVAAVTAASIARECQCPDDSAAPCHLE